MTQEIVRALVNGVWVTEVSNQGGGGGGGVTEITSTDMSITVTNPSGPTVDLSASGGSQPIKVVRVPFTHSDANTNGVSIYTPTAGELLIDAFIIVTTAFNGTTPYADIGCFGDNSRGFFDWIGALPGGFPVDLTGVASVASATDPGDGNIRDLRLAAALGGDGSSYTPIRFTNATPVLLVINTTGFKGDPASSPSVGAGEVVLVIANP